LLISLLLVHQGPRTSQKRSVDDGSLCRLFLGSRASSEMSALRNLCDRGGHKRSRERRVCCIQEGDGIEPHWMGMWFPHAVRWSRRDKNPKLFRAARPHSVTLLSLFHQVRLLPSMSDTSSALFSRGCSKSVFLSNCHFRPPLRGAVTTPTHNVKIANRALCASVICLSDKDEAAGVLLKQLGSCWDALLRRLTANQSKPGVPHQWCRG